VAVTNEKVDSVRLNRFEKKRLAWALALSLAAHFLVWGGYELGQKTGLWQRLHWPGHKQLAVKKVAPPPVQDSDPSIFLTVDDATPEPPKNTKYYSSKNSQAAQTDTSSRNSNQPKLNGKQTDVPNPRDVPPTPNAKLQPVQQLQPPSQIKMAAPPPSMMEVGDLKLSKPQTSPEKNETTPERPRTLNEARAQQANPLPKIQMQQDGGAQRTALQAAFDAKATQFGDYDAQMFGAIEQYWDDQLASQKFARDRIGRVTLRFHLNYDGSVTDMEVLQNQVGDLLCYVCQKAVNDTQPYAKWPSDMRRMIGDNYRQITLTFIYY
jgi:outer membrane biosynthesis protein TonB